MLAVTRFAVPDGIDFLSAGQGLLAALGARPGCRSADLCRALDTPGCWLVVTTWDGVGAYRRALSSYDVKLALGAVAAWVQPDPGAFEVVVSATPGSRRIAPPGTSAG